MISLQFVLPNGFFSRLPSVFSLISLFTSIMRFLSLAF